MRLRSGRHVLPKQFRQANDSNHGYFIQFADSGIIAKTRIYPDDEPVEMLGILRVTNRDLYESANYPDYYKVLDDLLGDYDNSYFESIDPAYKDSTTYKYVASSQSVDRWLLKLRRKRKRRIAAAAGDEESFDIISHVPSNIATTTTTNSMCMCM